MTAVLDYLPAIVKGIAVTIQVAVLSIAGCVAASIVLGLAMRSRDRVVSSVAVGVVEILRGASVLIYLFWVYYALPAVPGMPQFSPLVVSTIVLSLVGGSYGAEIVRAGLDAVPAGQAEAGRALGLTRLRVATLIVLPQALSQIVPGFASLAVDMVKWTSIVSFVGVQDVLYVANSIRTLTYQTVEVYFAVGLLYLALCVLASVAFRGLERALPMSRARRAASEPGVALRAQQAVAAGARPR